MLDALYIDDYQLHDTATASVRRVRGFGVPSARARRTARASADGDVDETRWRNGRVFEVEGELWHATPATLWGLFDDLKARLQLDATRTMRFRRRGLTEDEQAVVTIDSMIADLDDTEGVISYAAILVAADPRIYGSVLRSGSYDPALAQSGGGVSFAGGGVNFPLQFTTSTVSHLSLVNSGNTKTPPILNARGPVNNPTLDNDTTGEKFTLVGSLGSADTVVVDVATRSVKLNGVERKDLVDARPSTWWEMVKGTNQIRMRGTAMEAGKTLLTVQFRDARS